MVSHDRFFLDRIVDHLFVFRGNGVVKDFPGDYSTYRHCVQQEEKEARAAEAERQRLEAERQQRRGEEPIGDSRQRDRKVRLTYKEKKEMETLEVCVEELYAEKAALEADMSSGSMSHEALIAAGQRMEAIIAETDEAEMRLLELMEKQ